MMTGDTPVVNARRRNTPLILYVHCVYTAGAKSSTARSLRTDGPFHVGRPRPGSREESERIMVLPIVGKVTWGAFGLGAVTAAVGSMVIRPLIVETVRLGYEATDVTKEAWVKAKTEAESIKRDAQAKNAMGSTDSEVRQLREEVASLRAQVSAKRGSVS